SDDIPGEYRITDPNYTAQRPGNELISNYLTNGVLDLKNAVILCLKNNREFQSQKEDLYITALDQLETENEFNGIFTGEVESIYEKDSDVESMNTTASIGFNKLLASGARFGSNIGLGCIDILSGDARSGLSAIASATITQPLLRGAGRKVALENITQAQRNTMYKIRDFNQFRKVLVVEIISDYYNLLLLDNIKNNHMAYFKEMESLYGNLKTRANAGRIPLHELEQADQDRISAQTDLLEAQREYEDALDQFKLKLSMPVNTDILLDSDELTILADSVNNQIQLSEEQAIELAMDQRLDMLNAIDSTLDAERKAEVAADAIRAELNLVGNASSQRRLSPSSARGTENNYSLGLEMDLPLDRLAEKNAYRKAVIDIERAQRYQQEIRDIITTDIKKGYRKLEESREKYHNEISGLSLAQKRSTNTEALLKYGRANTRDLLDAREDYLDARNEVNKATIEYALANLEILRDSGIIKIKSDSSWSSLPDEKVSVIIDKHKQ
ncbi:MAG: TolC family protein, partial [Sedimentisphaerales bacterium]|nr:TolC family protein [Sedimentisphaerales bacterium]